MAFVTAMPYVGPEQLTHEGVQEVHHYHHMDKPEPRVAVKLEKNSRGNNWELSYSGDGVSFKNAIFEIANANAEMESQFGTKE